MLRLLQHCCWCAAVKCADCTLSCILAAVDAAGAAADAADAATDTAGAAAHAAHAAAAAAAYSTLGRAAAKPRRPCISLACGARIVPVY